MQRNCKDVFFSFQRNLVTDQRVYSSVYPTFAAKLVYTKFHLEAYPTPLDESFFKKDI